MSEKFKTDQEWQELKEKLEPLGVKVDIKKEKEGLEERNRTTTALERELGTNIGTKQNRQLNILLALLQSTKDLNEAELFIVTQIAAALKNSKMFSGSNSKENISKVDKMVNAVKEKMNELVQELNTLYHVSPNDFL